MRRLFISLGIVVAALLSVTANPSTSYAQNATVRAACGAMTYTPGTIKGLTQDTTGTLCTTAGEGGGGGGAATTTKATAADPTYIEGVTTNPFSVDLSGYMRSVVKGTVTANIGTVGTLSTAANQTSIIGTKAAGTAAASSMLTGFVYNSSLPTLTNGQQAAAQADSSGRLIVNCGTGCSGGTQFAEDLAHTTADVGTAALTVRKDTATALAGADGDYANLQTDGSGRLHVNVGASALPTGAATAANQTATQDTFGSTTAQVAVIHDSTGNTVDWDAPVSLIGLDGTTIATATNAVPVASSPTATTDTGLTAVVSPSVETGRVIKASAGNLYGLQVTSGASAGYVLVFNSTTVPAAGAVTPIKCYAIGASSTLGISYTPFPVYFSTGIAVAFSTTGCFTKTDSATAFISGDAK